MAARYGSGIIARDAETFLDDLLAVRRFDLWNLERGELRAAIFGPDTSTKTENVPYAEALRRIAVCYQQKEKPWATRFGFKNPNGIYHIDFILELFPEARILHMIRDPRGVLSSEKKKLTKEGRYKSKDMIWTVARRHRKMVQIAEAYEPDPRYLAIYYHELVTDFESTLEKVLDFLNLKFENEVRDYHLVAREGDFTPQKELWQHGKSLERPDPTRVDMFLTELSLRELSTIEMLCGHTLTNLPTINRSGTFMEGVIGVGQVLLSKIAQKVWTQKM
jgi:hypothetical protein